MSSYLSLRSGIIFMKTFQKLDSEFFSKYSSKLRSSGIGTDFEIEEANNQQNWMVIFEAADEYIKHF